MTLPIPDPWGLPAHLPAVLKQQEPAQRWLQPGQRERVGPGGALPACEGAVALCRSQLPGPGRQPGCQPGLRQLHQWCGQDLGPAGSECGQVRLGGGKGKHPVPASCGHLCPPYCYHLCPPSCHLLNLGYSTLPAKTPCPLELGFEKVRGADLNLDWTAFLAAQGILLFVCLSFPTWTQDVTAPNSKAC